MATAGARTNQQNLSQKQNNEAYLKHQDQTTDKNELAYTNSTFLKQTQVDVTSKYQ